MTLRPSLPPPGLTSVVDARNAADPPLELLGAMTRRALGVATGAALLTVGGVETYAQPRSRTVVNALVYPGMIMLDLIGPLTVFNIMGADIHLIWKDTTPVPTDLGLPVQPTATPASAPALADILFVPGGLGGTVAAMREPEVVAFLANCGASATWVTSVCTGSLLLGAAGLLKGYAATSHWYVVDMLAEMGATPRHERVVTDRNRMTGGGVTAGMDFGHQPRPAMLSTEPSARRIMIGATPAKFTRSGCNTPSAIPAATPASIALPPASMIENPADAAR